MKQPNRTRTLRQRRKVMDSPSFPGLLINEEEVVLKSPTIKSVKQTIIRGQKN